MKKLVSWNVNGLRAIARKGFLDVMAEIDPDIMCLQEIKAEKDQLPKNIQNIENYHSFFNPSRTKKGYSGTAIYTKEEPISVQNGLGDEIYDCEGRIQLVEFNDFTLYNIYYPNGQSGQERIDYKLNFYNYFLSAFISVISVLFPIIKII